MGINFQFIQPNSVLDIKLSGNKGRRPSTVMIVTDICVYQMKTSQNCQSSVTYFHLYGSKKVRKKCYISFTSKTFMLYLPTVQAEVSFVKKMCELCKSIRTSGSKLFQSWMFCNFYTYILGQFINNVCLPQSNCLQWSDKIMKNLSFMYHLTSRLICFEILTCFERQ